MTITEDEYFEDLEASDDHIGGANKMVEMMKTLDEWHEDDGPCLWWSLPIEEPPYVGEPLDFGFPDHLTHWARIPDPTKPTVIDALRGCRAMLHDAAKQFRLYDDRGHSAMCELHKAVADEALAS